MSMLAEPRSRQKWSDDPRNTRWANDKSKFGYQMMTKMGWSEGKGLGQNECGDTNHITVKKRNSNAGIGTKRSHDDDWIAHQNDFNDLLNSLNQGMNNKVDSSRKINSLEDRVKSSKKKILYTKFVKSKDLSNASAHDLACIFGQRSKSAPATPQISDDEGNTSDISSTSCPVTDKNINTSTEHGFTTVRTGVSIADYFAKKMAALKKEDGAVEENEHKDDEASSQTDLPETRKEKKKRLKEIESEKSENSQKIKPDKPCDEDSVINIECSKKKKVKVKAVDGVDIVDVVSDSDSSVNEVIDVDTKKIEYIELESESKSNSDCNKIKKKKKKSKIINLTGEVSCDSIDDENDVIVSKKKKKKKKNEKLNVIELDNDCDVTNDISAENSDSTSSQKTSKKKKKRKKERNEIDAAYNGVEASNETITDIGMKRKKKRKELSDGDSDIESNVKRMRSSNGDDFEDKNSENLVSTKKKKKKKKKKNDSAE